ncbi:MAG: hypothetical protein F4Z72_05360 [Gemmatimonadales bacterium]|nr:hypothetical protein [Candidatus Palauibacter irciniicola]MYC17564.1 hypothetical protein [Gemmatimonadales bacterium]
MRRLQNSFVALFPTLSVALALTFVPVDSTDMAGIIGVAPLCAQEDPVSACVEAWYEITWDAYLDCGGLAECAVGCDSSTGDVLWAVCDCIN